MVEASGASLRAWIASALLPPVGMVWHWFRPGLGIGRKLLYSFLTALWGLVLLVVVFGLRVQLDGSGSRPLFSFGAPEDHYAELERDRAAQKAEPAPVPEPAQAEPEAVVHAAEAAAPTPKAEPARSETPQAYWTDFRGPRRDGHYDQAPILTDWPATGLDLLWHQPIGGGYASFVVAGGRAFTIEQRRKQEAATAYDLKTGREVWATSWSADFQESMGGPGPRATPAWFDGRVYVLGAEGELRCLEDSSGKTLWRRNILQDNDAGNLPWGMAAAPLVFGDKVIVLPGGSPKKSVVAYNRLTGEPVWKALDDKQAYVSPMLVDLAGQRQLVVVAATRAVGLVPETGAVLWEYPWPTDNDINSSQPIVIPPNRLFLSSGYGHGAAVIELTRNGDRLDARTVWENKRMKNKFSSSVLHEGYIYGLDESILACIDAGTGELKWKGGRYGYGQLLLASGHLIVTTETGDVVLVKATPDSHQEVSRFPAVQGKTWNYPAMDGGVLLVRNATEMAAFRIAR